MTDSTRVFGVAQGRTAGIVLSALRQAAEWPVRVYRARALMHQLAALDVRELRDIGLTPADLRDATALPWDEDPSPTLRRRVEGRRRPR